MNAVAATENDAQRAPSSDIGRLSDVGVREAWQAPLLLPTHYEDCQVVETDGGDLDDGRKMILHGTISGRPEITKPQTGTGPWRFNANISLSDGTCVEAAWIGDTAKLKAAIQEGQEVWVYGTVKLIKNRWQLWAPELISKKWAGRLQPVYPGSGRRLPQAELCDRVVALLRSHHVDTAARLAGMLVDLASPQEILEAVHAPSSCESIERLLVRAHAPSSKQEGLKAIEALERLAALVMLKEMIDAEERSKTPRAPLQLQLSKRLQQWKKTPSPDQKKAVIRLSQIFSAPHIAQALLSGDVGTGKTLVYLTLAAGVVDAGGRVAILEPDGRLAKQVAEEMRSVFPDITFSLVHKDSKASGAEHALAIGTTALLSRNPGEFDLLICDEQQKLGAEQRRALCGPKTHKLDATATAIPRTMALAVAGAIEIIRLEKGHTDKTIRTRLWSDAQRRDLFAEIHKTIASGAKTLVIYPTIEKSESGARKGVSIEEVAEKWERQFKGLVRTIHGQQKGSHNDSALDDLRTGKASIGICTTAVEVGISIPNLRRLVVAGSEAHGLTTLHQLRGRLAREGGQGDFDMLVNADVGDDTKKRLGLLIQHNDGFALAEADMRSRGAGELSVDGVRQSGDSGSILIKRPMNPDFLTELEPVLRKWWARAATTKAESKHD